MTPNSCRDLRSGSLPEAHDPLQPLSILPMNRRSARAILPLTAGPLSRIRTAILSPGRIRGVALSGTARAVAPALLITLAASWVGHVRGLPTAELARGMPAVFLL